MVHAIILATGTDPRANVERASPRCLTKVGGETILQRQIEILKSCGLKDDDIKIVIGGKGRVWSDENKEKVSQIHPHVIVNPHNLETHDSYSFWLAVKNVNDDVVCIDGDLLFSKEILESVITHGSPSLILMKKMRHLLGGNKVSVKSNRVVGVSAYNEPEVIYMGVSKFSKELLDALKKELNSIEHFNSALAVPLDKICAEHYIYGLDIEELMQPHENK